MHSKALYDSKNVLWKDVYSNDGIAWILNKLIVRQNEIIKHNLPIDHKRLIGINLLPSKSTVESIPYLMKTDFERLIDEVVEMSDYIVLNISEFDKTKRKTLASFRTKQDLTKLIQKTNRRLAINLGKIAASEYWRVEPEDKTSLGIINIQSEIKRARIRTAWLTKNNVPLILLKIDSYLTESEYKTIAEVMNEQHVDGVIIGSTIPINVGIKNKNQRLINDDKAAGGAGGDYTKANSDRALQIMYNHTKGKKLLISSGGIFTGEDVYNRMANGANLVQVSKF